MALLLPSDGPLGFAGIWTTWQPHEGDPVQSCAIITREAEGNTAEVHDRMPAFLPREAWERWVAPGDAEPEELLKMVLQAPAPALRTPEVSKVVNNPRNDKSDVLKPA